MARRKTKKKYSIGSLLILLAFAVLVLYRNYQKQEPSQDGFQPEKRTERPKPHDKKEARALKTFTGKVVGIKDGDTFEVLYEGQTERVRLAEIDCPESAQPFGKAAKKFASDLCFGKTVTVEAGGKRDRYGRVVGTVFTDEGINVNQELVKAGLAWHYKDYSDSDELAAIEEQARAENAGLWADNNPVAPWDWRKNKRKRR
ncbi:thermonuclease family protein [Flavobacterium sp.]|uniref:thermonuclease family protein n=1 Tax=Flavobacterium sp. TaxID=239 RepID=UPI002602BCCB|nr:thermonuclease family protein [Flavobacterium sp.]